MRRILPYIAGIIYSSIFGFSFLFTKEGLEELPPFHLLAFRFSIAAILLSLLLLFRIIKIDFRNKKTGLLLLLSLVQPCLYFIFETLGIYMTSSSEAGMIIALIPVAVTILAAFLLNEKPTFFQTLFILISISGVFFNTIMQYGVEERCKIPGILFLLLAVLMASIYNIQSRKLSLWYRPVEITFAMMWTGAVFFNILALLSNRGGFSLYLIPLFNLKVLISVLYLGILSSVSAFFLMNYTLSKIEAAPAAVFAYFSTIVTIMAGVLIRGEKFYWYHFIGALLIITGVSGTNFLGRRKREEISKELSI